jgi:hypothetical protein
VMRTVTAIVMDAMTTAPSDEMGAERPLLGRWNEKHQECTSPNVHPRHGYALGSKDPKSDDESRAEAAEFERRAISLQSPSAQTPPQPPCGTIWIVVVTESVSFFPGPERGPRTLSPGPRTTHNESCG